MIEDKLAILIKKSIANAQNKNEFNDFVIPEVQIDRPHLTEHGDFATNIALQLKSKTEKDAMENAEIITNNILDNEVIENINIVLPGFININVKQSWIVEQIKLINNKEFGNHDLGLDQSVQIEYVSSNPTGPIHIGNGRGASIGATLAKVLKKCGYRTEEEFYINDTGNQVKLFGETLFARYSALYDVKMPIPENGYLGEYMIDLANKIKNEYHDSYLDEEKNTELTELGLSIMIEQIQDELSSIGVEYTNWFYESMLHEKKTLELVIRMLDEKQFISHKDNAVWFLSTKLGDDKDNVLIRSDGTPTYFAADIAYHFNKFSERKFDRVINIWGADHQGHVSRLKKAMKALNINEDRLDVLLYQLITLKRGNTIVPLSKRSGDIISLNEVFTETGKDAMRFFFLSQSANQSMDFDLELAKKQTKDNPVYYVQYAHARIHAILDKASHENYSISYDNLDLIKENEEISLIKKLIEYPSLIKKVATELAPHHLPHYSIELAQLFHIFYTKCRVIDESNKKLTEARLALLDACRIVLRDTLELIGVTAPEQM
tara:strand:+ start:707 stop:2353 length:1647 start_codon:yes stop_codon:yes gene_type:complete